MLYYFVKIMMLGAMGMFFEKITARNLDNIPQKGAALLIANHPSSLMDAALLGILIKRPIHFFARGDIFIHPLVARVLNALHMHPVHHHQGGRQTLGANKESFKKAIELLSAGELVLFFPEGSSHIEYSLHPFRKGAFRIAFQTISLNPGLILPIIPIGINYSHPTNLFSRVWVHAGPALITNDLLDTYQLHPTIALKQLTQRCYHAVQNLAIDSRHLSPRFLFLALDTWRQSNQAVSISSTHQIEAETAISNAYPIWWQQAEEPLKHYEDLLLQAGCTPATIGASALPKTSVMPLIIGFPAAIIGWLLNALPLILARHIADQKVKRIDFYSWILVSSSAILWLCWFIFMAILSFSFLPSWEAIAILFISISTGQYCWNYFAYYQKWKARKAAKKLPTTELANLQLACEKVLAAIQE
jgi:1-acyl-sn-glycerol-3-phosphate acyltransferase